MRRVALVAVALAVAVYGVSSHPLAGQIPPYGGAGQYVADLSARRAKLMSALGPDSVLVLWSAAPRVYSADTNYEYRQESNLLYLSGIDQEDSILVLVPGARSRKEFLFVREADPTRELWNGHVLTPDEVRAQSGVTNVYTQRGTEQFDAFITGLLGGTGYRQSPDEATAEFGTLAGVVRSGKARLGILDRIPSGGAGIRPSVLAEPRESRGPWALEIRQQFPGVTPFSAADLLNTQRQIKTSYEQAVLKRSVEISAEAHLEGMRATRPGRWEYEVEAAIEYWFLKNGALSWGYPSIVGSGPNATTLHYLKSTRQMKSGDLLLVDAAANFQGLTGDITRTYPVNAKFSSEQRAIYELVLRAQEAGIDAAKPGSRVADITAAIRRVFADGLLGFGLITEATPGPAQNAQVSLWFPHSPTHGIGMDVHDPLGRLDPGAAFVIEPGLYIRSDTLTNLPKTPENAAFAARVTPAVAKYRDTGVRIEDSFLMTAGGPLMMSAKAPRKVSDIERVVGTGR